MKVRALQRCLLSVSVVMRFKFEQCDNKGLEQKGYREGRLSVFLAFLESFT